MPEDPIQLGERVFYITDERIVLAANITAFDPEDCNVANLCVFIPRGLCHPRERVQRAYYNGTRWMVLHKWIRTLDEVPNDEYHLPLLNTQLARDHAKLNFIR